MEAPSTGQKSLRCVTVEEEDPWCKCDEGWTCTITKTEQSKAGSPYSKCGGGNCNCVTNASTEASNLEQVIKSCEGGKAFCKCGPGWSCVISKTDPQPANRNKNTFFECGEGCVCVIDETNTVRMAYV